MFLRIAKTFMSSLQKCKTAKVKKDCLERQSSSVPFIVQYESRNNQVHFTGCKDRKNT